MWWQSEIQLKPRERGFHLITHEIIEQVPALADFQTGMLNIFLKHTSAGLTINENADPTVRGDFARFFDRVVPEGAEYFEHTDEGPDDMPAHIKSSLLGNTVSLPVSAGQLRLGTWQGVYLCEFRDRAGGRRLVLTLHGE